jgi:tetratricopeptide (TPR) repeat protein
LEAEILAEKYHTEIIMHYGLKRSADLVFAQRIAGYVEKLKTYTDRLSSYRLNLFAHQVYISQSMLMADYARTAQRCRDALHYFEQPGKRTSRVILINLSSQLMVSLQMLGQYEEGISIGKKILVLTPSQSVSWFAVMEDLYRLYLHSEKYELALENVIEVKNNPALSKQVSLLQERWRSNEAMIHYLIRSGKLQQPHGSQIKFRIKKFINDSSGSIHDKSGNNTLLITLMILFLLLDKDYSSIIDKIDALKAYTHRHLRRDETYRTNCFIKMIMQLDKGDFHPVAVQRKAEPYYKKLLEVPLHKAKQDYDLEIIPYETIWSFILESLEPDRKTKVQDR